MTEKTGRRAVEQGLPDLYPRLWRFCLVLSKDRTVADDLAQKTCLRALEKAGQFRAGTHLDRWVFTLARRIWLNDLRAEQVRGGSGNASVEQIDVLDTKSSAETNIFAAEVFDLVQALPEGQRLAVLLVYVEGYAYREAAAALDVPIGTIMSRLATARRSISQKVDDEKNG